MNKEELEKLFEEKFFIKNGNIEVVDYLDIKDFIFNIVIPEVLKSVFEYEKIKNKNEGIVYWDFKEYFKQQAKELYNIEL